MSAIKPLSIYVHIPFCIKKCAYCDFLSFSDCEDFFELYVDSLIEEIKSVSVKCENYLINSIYFGGGTPSVLPLVLIEKIIVALRRCFNFSSNLEFSIETNPGSLSYYVLEALYELGVNRISMGLQSSSNLLLEKLGRIHSVEQFVENYSSALAAGFSNINVDLMFSLPSQTLQDWLDTLDFIISLRPAHVSAYSLSIEENSAFGKSLLNGSLSLPDELLDRRMYSLAREKFADAGFVQYEISNFSLPFRQCAHNLVYWNCNEYVGFGLGAHSFLSSYRYNNCCDLKEYLAAKGISSRIVRNRLFLSPADLYGEFMFMGLRLIDGVDVDVFKHRFGISVDEVFSAELDKLVALNLIARVGKKIFLTDRGLDLSNVVFVEFI